MHLLFRKCCDTNVYKNRRENHSAGESEIEIERERERDRARERERERT